MKKHFDYAIRSATDWFLWILKRQSRGLSLVKLGGKLLLALIGIPIILSLIVPTENGTLPLTLTLDGSTPLTLFTVALIIAVILIVIGLFLLLIEAKELLRKKVIVIELRGLRNISGEPLKNKIPARIDGRREELLVDIRQGADGRILSPDDALRHLLALPASIAHRESGLDRSDISYVVGGLASVPFSFLMGVLLDDESPYELMDWDRDLRTWRELNELDDKERFIVNGLEKIGDSVEAVLAVSVSYPANSGAISQTFPGIPVINIALPTISHNAHWSRDKQLALISQFLDVIRGLCSTKTRRIHLVLAAPNSIAIRFGSAYDRRNLPELIVYQYEQDQNPQYPWGILMPVAGTLDARIV